MGVLMGLQGKWGAYALPKRQRTCGPPSASQRRPRGGSVIPSETTAAVTPLRSRWREGGREGVYSRDTGMGNSRGEGGGHTRGPRRQREAAKEKLRTCSGDCSGDGSPTSTEDDLASGASPSSLWATPPGRQTPPGDCGERMTVGPGRKAQGSITWRSVSKERSASNTSVRARSLSVRHSSSCFLLVRGIGTHLIVRGLEDIGRRNFSAIVGANRLWAPR
jgi:hypothetical protein